MGDRYWEALARILDHPALEPVRPAFGMRGDDDLVRAEGAERILDRLHRVSVSDLSPRLDARVGELVEALFEALLSCRPRAVVVGHPVPKRGVQRGRYDEHFRAHAVAPLENRGPQGLAA